jgi:hypothetical protein
LRYPPENSLNRLKESSLATSLVSNLTPHLVVLIACFSILVGALVLAPADSGNGYLEFGRISLPQVCIFKNLTGLPCPGCGLSRSIVAAMHGKMDRSLAHHRLGWLILVYIFLQFMYRLGLIVIPRLWAQIFPSGKLLNRGIVALGILFMLNWILNLILMSSS